ncbi:MAG: carbon-nitrogen hydrolase family protein [Lachnotalea sp.]
MSNPDKITIGVVNFNVRNGDKEHNLTKIEKISIEAAKKNVDLILFPETCLMGYDYFINENILMEEKIKHSEKLDGESVNRIKKIAQSYEIYIIFGMSEKDDNGNLYNSAIITEPNGTVGAYRKIHPFDKENTWCLKGTTPFMIDTKWGLISVGICYDTYQFPELMRYYVAKGSRLYLNLTALAEEINLEGSKDAFLKSYTTMLEYGVLANSIYIASSNLCGYDHFNYFGGGSMVIGPKETEFKENNLKVYCGDDRNVNEGLFFAEIDLSLSKRDIFQKNAITDTPDFRPDLYKQLYSSL